MSLKIWLPLDGDLHNQGINNYTTSLVSGNIFTTPGKIGNNSLHLTKLQPILPNSTASCMRGAKQMSYAYWIKVNTAWAANWLDGIRWVSTDGSTAHTSRQEFYTNCTLIGTWFQGGSIGGKSFTPGIWTHIAGTFNYNTGEVCFYINGTLFQKKTTLATTHYCRGDFWIGDNGVDIQQNDVRIYDHCLSAAEVKEIAQGLILHYKLDSIGPGLGNPNLLKNTDKYSLSGSGAAGITRSIEDGVYKVVAATTNSNYCTFTSHNTTLDLAQGDTFTFSMMIKSPDSVKKPTVYFQSGLGYYNTSGTMSPEWSIIYYTGTWSISNLTTNIHLGFKAAPGTYYIKYLKIEKGSTYTPWAPKAGERYSDINFVNDSSGYNHNGQIISNTVITRNTTRYSTSMLFDGVDDCIIVPYNAICPENIFTINLWFKKDALGSKNYETLFGGPSGFEMDTRAGSSSALSLYMASTRGGNAATGLQLNTWYMVTMVRDGTNERYYINGELEKEIAAKAMPTGVYRIGAWDSNTKQNYYGNISDFRIYCTPLLDTDIKQLYNTSMRIDKNQNIHTFELCEEDRDLLYTTPWTSKYTYHNKTNISTSINSNGEYELSGASTSLGTDYIEINPTNKTYYYDFTISANAGNQIHIGFERYDVDKTTRSNNATVYALSTKPSSDIVKKRYKGTINLSTDGVNPSKYTALRILNEWSGTTSGVTGTLTIHNFSLREISSINNPSIMKNGELDVGEIKEYNNAQFYNNGIVETNTLIER